MLLFCCNFWKSSSLQIFPAPKIMAVDSKSCCQVSATLYVWRISTNIGLKWKNTKLWVFFLTTYCFNCKLSEKEFKEVTPVSSYSLIKIFMQTDSCWGNYFCSLLDKCSFALGFLHLCFTFLMALLSNIYRNNVNQNVRETCSKTLKVYGIECNQINLQKPFCLYILNCGQ